jgi:alpha-beta hydrolase superfamily lysophospholipase
VAPERGQGFVFCYPEFEEKLWTERVFVSFARELAARGYHVLRFDSAGHGDSDGEFVHASLSSRLDDLDCAVRALAAELGAQTGRVCAAIVHVYDFGPRFQAIKHRCQP